jgi:hypothetical protein
MQVQDEQVQVALVDSEFLWCHITNEVPRVFVRYDDLDQAWLELQKLWYKGVSKNL